MSTLGPRILGMGHTVPGKIRLNDDPIFDWLKKHVVQGKDLFAGYNKRHVLSEGEKLIDIMHPAAQLALDNAGIKAEQIDLLLGDASISAYRTPNAISELHHKLGLPSRALPLPVRNTFSQFNAGVMVADALIRAGRANYILLALGDNWSRYVDYHTPQAISAADGAAACVIGPSQDGSKWAFVDEITVADTSYYGSMYMAHEQVKEGFAEATQDFSGLESDAEFTQAYFHITKKGIDGFTEFGIKKAPDAVLELLSRNRVASKDVCLITHQASTKLMDQWQKVIQPAEYVQTIADYANLVQCSVLFNLSWGMQNAQMFTQNWVVTLCLGPDMHANAMLMRRND